MANPYEGKEGKYSIEDLAQDNLPHKKQWNLILAGPPGAGKTTVGKVVAAKLEREWYDVDDHHLEMVVWKRPVADALADLGDEGFAAAEADASRLLNTFNIVVSLTGSVPLDERAVTVCRSIGGPIVFLDADLNTTIESRGQGNDRIVGKKPGMTVLDVLHRRDTYYQQMYDLRVGVTGRTPEEIADEIIDRCMTGYNWMLSTRGDGGHGRGVDFLRAIRQGLAPDGGLYVPARLPPPQGHCFKFWAVDLSYEQVAQRVVELFIDFNPLARGFNPQELNRMIRQAYHPRNWSSPDIVPLVSLKAEGDESTAGHFALELFHGPTGAFKDLPLQLFPRMFGRSIQGESYKYCILAATSGDTGVATISGFAQQQDVGVMVLFPKNGVSPVQKAQMLAFDGHDNGRVKVVAVDGDFDACQSAVKAIFNDPELGEKFQYGHKLKLSSANSINWGRLVAQVAYHVWGYLRLVSNKALKDGEECNIAVPSGNFGNILSAWLAKRLGVPVGKLVLASNANCVLSDFINTGVYDISDRTLATTSSPSIDILRSSNLERLLFWMSGGNSEEVAGYMKDLAEKKRFEVSEGIKAQLKADFWAGSCSEEECARTIQSVQASSGYVMCPHTAVGYKVVKDFEAAEYGSKGAKAPPMVLSATAHWAKFPVPVLKALQGGTADPSAPVGKEDVQAAFDGVSAAAPKAHPVPAQLASAITQTHEAAEVSADIPSIARLVEAFADTL